MRRSSGEFLKRVVSLVTVLVFAAVVSGCQKKEGPMEKAGKKADEGVEATKEAVKEAGEKMREGAEKTEEALRGGAEKAEEKAGE